MEYILELQTLVDKNDSLIIGDRVFSSRFFTGSGKFSSPEVLRTVIEASETQVVTVAVRRVNLAAKGEEPATRGIDRTKVLILPNTSGARNAEEAVRLAALGKALCGHSWVKLEVTPDPLSLLPDGVETLKAAKILISEGYTVLPYINADPILALHLQDAGCATVMPLAAPIGTNKGLKTEDQIRIIIDRVRIPVVVDAGLGLPSHAAAAMELGASAVLANTALATASNPQMMAKAFAAAVISGRMGYLSRPGAISEVARASSPLTGFLRRDS
ncbi:thiazole synthase [Myxococcota bacterium]|nr:thiazole synthase [Myxococcota bacterium]MBU1379942.1 thiazole synthase [Myxococcota bacterium]MBU1497068.1 thiazole synthase [Myxococcota bacterium]